MRLTLEEVAALVDGELTGPGDITVTNSAPLEEAGPHDIAFLTDRSKRALLATTSAAAVVVSIGIDCDTMPVIHVAAPDQAMALVLRSLSPPQAPAVDGIHPSAAIHQSATLGNHVSLGPHVTIGADVLIGDNVCIGPGSTVGDETQVGNDTWLHASVTLYPRVSIGSHVIIHSGAVVGSDGYGYLQDGATIVKVPQIGTVLIGDDVEIGANTAIDRATLGATVIGAGTKVDNLVQIGHNVSIGRNVRICAQVGIAGSTTVEDGVVIAGQAGLMDHITVGSYAQIGGQAGVTKSVASKTAVSGYPARPHSSARRLEAYVNRLPDLAQQVKNQQRQIEQLQAVLKERE